ncbi:hypothetical protein N7456_012069 [Penicillium angulare]|uniref:Methyltransferase n=1 Tax=Penicillium angulare TaxID=116970 RepID=A0A9W9K0D3_9EURO|nr:hypothetical protein N7456_012069 [Penicillium angulare]
MATRSPKGSMELASDIKDPHSGPCDAITTLRFLKWQDLYLREKPFQLFCPLSDLDAARSNLAFEERSGVVINDARGKESEFDLDKQGFAFTNLEVDSSVFSNASSITETYLPKVKSLIQEKLKDVLEIRIFDWQIRRTWTTESGIIDGHDKSQHLLPSSHVHLDQDATNVPRMIRRHFPEKPESVMKRRVRIINVWKPLVDTVNDHPLAICDGSTIADSDLVAADHITRGHFDINCYGLFSERHIWWYLNRQRQNEAILFKNFDADETVLAKHCLHTSFLQYPENTQNPSRESIEVRALVVS